MTGDVWSKVWLYPGMYGVKFGYILGYKYNENATVFSLAEINVVNVLPPSFLLCFTGPYLLLYYTKHQHDWTKCILRTKLPAKWIMWKQERNQVLLVS